MTARLLEWRPYGTRFHTSCFEALPDTLQGTATADDLQAIVEPDLDTLAAIEPPHGYRRD